MSGAPFRIPRTRRLMVVIGVSVLIAASLAVAFVNEAVHRSETLDAARVQAGVLAQTVPAALSFEDAQSLVEYVRAVGFDPRVRSVGIYDQSGHLTASYGDAPPSLASDPTVGASSEGFAALAPVIEKGVRLGTVYLTYRPESIDRRFARYFGAAILVVMASMMFLVMGLDARALMRANIELKRQMAEREKAEAALRQSQKMEAVGRLTGGVAHDFNNMLSIVMGSLDLLIGRLEPNGDPRILRLANNAMEGARRAANLTQRLLAFSRRQPLNPTSASIASVLAETADLLRRTLGEAILVETVAGAGLWRARIDVPQLESVLVNLGINARDAMPEGGRLTLEASNTYLDAVYAEHEDDVTPGQYVMIAVTDTGVGMTPEVMAQVFEPFFTTKPVGQGTGLGLSQAHGFIKQSGGHIRLHSEVDRGTTVKLYLPRSMEDAPAHTAAIERSADASRRNVTILVVEDEPGVREFAVEALVDLGFDVLASDGADEALRLLGAHPQIRVLLTDVVMPGVTGKALAVEAQRRRRDLIVVFMTGYTPDAIVHNGVLDPGVRLITKPFTVARLGAEMDSVLASRG
jgi:signal transduction histidine kinase